MSIRPRSRQPLTLLLVLASCTLPSLAFLYQGGIRLTPRTHSVRHSTLRMMAKNVKFGDKGLDKLVEGINVVGNAVKVSTH